MTTFQKFFDRTDAGRQLGQRLLHYRGDENVRVLALPRGGVVTGLEVVSAIKAPLDILIVCRIGVPGRPELAVAAVCETGATAVNREVLKLAGLSEMYVQYGVLLQQAEISRRIELYRRGRDLDLGSLQGKTVILIDDGFATGAEIKAAIAALKRENLMRLVVALPVSSPETANRIENMVDEFICILCPDDFGAAGQYYRDFSRISDNEAAALFQSSPGLQ